MSNVEYKLKINEFKVTYWEEYYGDDSRILWAKSEEEAIALTKACYDTEVKIKKVEQLTNR